MLDLSLGSGPTQFETTLVPEGDCRITSCTQEHLRTKGAWCPGRDRIYFLEGVWRLRLVGNLRHCWASCILLSNLLPESHRSGDHRKNSGKERAISELGDEVLEPVGDRMSRHCATPRKHWTPRTIKRRLRETRAEIEALHRAISTLESRLPVPSVEDFRRIESLTAPFTPEALLVGLLHSTADSLKRLSIRISDVSGYTDRELRSFPQERLLQAFGIEVLEGLRAAIEEASRESNTVDLISLEGSLKPRKTGVTLTDMENAIRRGASED